jgi:hypothetical protein
MKATSSLSCRSLGVGGSCVLCLSSLRYVEAITLRFILKLAKARPAFQVLCLLVHHAKIPFKVLLGRNAANAFSSSGM